MPEIENVDVEKVEKLKKENLEIKLPKELLENPYKYICNYYESLYPFIGRQAFSIISLMPPSLIMPQIPDKKKKIKQKINLFLIANPGAAKTSIAEEFEKIAINPIFSESMTPAYLSWELKDKDKITLITSDIAHSLENEEFVKMLEGIIGDEGTISRATMKNKELRKKIDAVAFMSGTPNIIANDRIRDGLLFRCSPLIITHTTEEHEKILDHVNEGIGVEGDEHELEYILNFYQSLIAIQEEEHPKINRIEGYIIPEDIKKDLLGFLKPFGFEEFGINAVRQLQEAYRFMCAHAFLNIYNKKKEGKIKRNKLEIDELDLKISKYLMDIEIDTIFHIVDSLSELKAKNIKTYKQLKEWQDRKKKSNSRDERKRKFIQEGAVKK